MSTEPVIPERWRELYDALKVFHGSHEEDIQQQLIEELGTAESLVRELARVMDELSALAVGEGDVCELIARRLRAALSRIPEELQP